MVSRIVYITKQLQIQSDGEEGYLVAVDKQGCHVPRCVLLRQHYTTAVPE